MYLYLFGLIVGGILLGASILLGGKDSDGDGHADGDADKDKGGIDKGLDKGMDKALDKGAESGGGHGAFDAFLWSFASIRFWTFFLAFFGMTGLALTALDTSTLVTLFAAIGMGLVTGLGAVQIIRALAADTTTSSARSSDYIGKTVKVRVPLEKGTQGQVRLQVKGSTVDVLATTDENDGFKSGEEALIIEMDGHTARIARVGERGSTS
jgi:membrane protein implicated in regulation of membrane protease activity